MSTITNREHFSMLHALPAAQLNDRITDLLITQGVEVDRDANYLSWPNAGRLLDELITCGFDPLIQTSRAGRNGACISFGWLVEDGKEACTEFSSEVTRAICEAYVFIATEE